MNIKILGTGCPNCQKLEANTKQALKELGVDGTVEKVTDVLEIAGYGVMSTPAIIANEKILSCGFVPTVEEIKKLFANERKATIGDGAKKCSCNGDCR